MQTYTDLRPLSPPNSVRLFYRLVVKSSCQSLSPVKVRGRGDSIERWTFIPCVICISIQYAALQFNSLLLCEDEGDFLT